MEKKKTLLVVGAGGFIGGFIASEGLKRGYDVWAGIRESTSRRYLTEKELHFAVFDYDDFGKLQEQISAPLSPMHLCCRAGSCS